ncbi:threonyl-tRNA synthetase [Mycoplasma testudineum]|uniref:Threonine--tRNA ligase n=1 Tax=Mycoplasma testudineum TaxID=244584 RepID=A0A4R6IFF8_9MOLU|nr:threonine--tRNA ligase [Mycoplasma testudineum]OYD26884.1 threonine--tRNA ligase [Mycoplasma testudineum]TDO20377.1 threonyl-tRNA synthetase [Mycoplasma testudineum]
MDKELNYNFKLNKELNHTASHILATAVLKLFPDTKLGFGPTTDEGFYYDFEFSKPITDSDLLKIEKQMKKIAAQNLKMQQVSINEYSFTNQDYKKELYDQYKSEGRNITFYSLKDSKDENVFVDLCAGGHIDETKNIKHIKLLSLAGAYWRGNSDNIQLTRIYGTAWDSEQELENYLAIVQDRKERDHRKIGKQLNIFAFNPMAGQGFPIWLPNGMMIKNSIQQLVLKLDRKYGFTEVYTPPFGEESLYKTSGHLAHYRDDMFNPIVVENEKLIPRPMTCPHHILIYKMAKRSYRDLPMRLSEQSRLYRYEKSGALTGLERVRAMELTEGHIFIAQDQIRSEILHELKFINEILNIFKIKIDYISLSLRGDDKEKYHNDDNMWQRAEKALKDVLDEQGIKYKVKYGEAAFYGPKIDFQVKTVLNHEITMSTLQLDFLLPIRFDMQYVSSNGEYEQPILIHRGLIGTYERFISILLEQTKGNLPFWISPLQAVVIPLGDKQFDYAKKVYDKLFELGINVKLDSRPESVAKKIREAQMNKAKYQIVIGDDEIEKNIISIREYGQQKTTEITVDELIKIFESKVKKYE